MSPFKSTLPSITTLLLISNAPLNVETPAVTFNPPAVILAPPLTTTKPSLAVTNPTASTLVTSS